MGRLPEDVLQFIAARFAPKDCDELASMLDQQPTLAPRVLRAVLFLADGRISLLRHYLEQAQSDVREVILAAEYVLGVADEPLHVRDMSEPFWSERNLGEAFSRPRRCPRPPPRPGRPAKRAEHPARRRERGQHHAALANRRFELGDVCYVVMNDQPSQKYVRCLRIGDKVTTMVRLPLEFVLEQVAEYIEIKSVG